MDTAFIFRYLQRNADFFEIGNFLVNISFVLEVAGGAGWMRRTGLRGRATVGYSQILGARGCAGDHRTGNKRTRELGNKGTREQGKA
jgi:hypothetical protein